MKRWYFWFVIAISALFLFLALRGLHLGQVWQSIQGANLLWLIPAVAVYFIDVIFRSLRWQILLKPTVQLDLGEVFPVISIGYLGNNIFPARGELCEQSCFNIAKFNSVTLATYVERILMSRHAGFHLFQLTGIKQFNYILRIHRQHSVSGFLGRDRFFRRIGDVFSGRHFP